METKNFAPASSTNLKVAYHSGGLLFAGDERDFPAGWYLFDGKDAYPVTVFEPFSNDVIEVDREGDLEPHPLKSSPEPDMETIRSILRTRDSASESDIDDLFANATDDIADGIDPEDVLSDTFGLEPDYLFDAEFIRAVKRGLARRA